MKNVNILSLSFGNNRAEYQGWEGVLKMINEYLNGTEDIVILPETCLGQTELNEYGDAFLSGIADIASKNNVYILASVYRKIDHETRVNSAILYDRDGNVSFTYDKVYPWIGEFDYPAPQIIPGSHAVYADTDFGRISATICFDANFPDLWQNIADLDVDLVLFSSAYSAGSQLCAHALNHHYAIVTATQKPDFAVYEINGVELTYKREQPEAVLISRTRIDLDKVICHFNYNKEKVQQMLADYSGQIEIEHEWEREEWLVIRSIDPDISLRDICKKYGIETLREYKRRAHRLIEDKRTVY